MLQILIENTIISRQIRQETCMDLIDMQLWHAALSESSAEIRQLTTPQGNASIDPFLEVRDQDPNSRVENRVLSQALCEGLAVFLQTP